MEKQATALLDDLTLAPPAAAAPARPRRTPVPTAPGAG